MAFFYRKFGTLLYCLNLKYFNMKKLFFLIICTVLIASCSNESTTSDEVNEVVKDEFTDYNLIVANHKNYIKMKKAIPNLGVTYYLDDNGNVAALFNPNQLIQKDDSAPSLVCGPEDSVEALAPCIEENLVKHGICTTTVLCAFCAYEADCPN